MIDMAGIYEEKYDLLIEGTKISRVEKNIEPEEDWEIIDAAGRLVTPGIVESHCHTGMGAWALGDLDVNETTNPVLPGIRAVDAVNPMDKSFRSALENGVTTLITGPGSSNLIGGTFVAIKSYGKTVEECVINPEICMKMALGENTKLNYGKRGKAPSTRMMSAALIREQLYKAKEYHQNYIAYQEKVKKGESASFSHDIHLHSLMRVFDGMRVKFHCHQADDILTAMRIAEEFNLRYTLDHCTEGHLIMDEIKRKNPQCILGPIFGGMSKYEVHNKTEKAAAVFEKAGIKFSIATDNGVIPMDGLLTQVAMLVKYGLSRETALRAITINAAEVTDVDDRVGSIEVGKDADVVIWNEDPLSTNSEVGIVISDGKVRYESEATPKC
jgi:Imidazolonepropionase and related amidohydrolases